MLYEIQPTGPARRLATQQVRYDQEGKSAVHSGVNCSNTHNIISSMAPHEFNVILRTTTDEFNVLPSCLSLGKLERVFGGGMLFLTPSFIIFQCKIYRYCLRPDTTYFQSSMKKFVYFSFKIYRKY